MLAGSTVARPTLRGRIGVVFPPGGRGPCCDRSGEFTLASGLYPVEVAFRSSSFTPCCISPFRTLKAPVGWRFKAMTFLAADPQSVMDNSGLSEVDGGPERVGFYYRRF